MKEVVSPKQVLTLLRKGELQSLRDCGVVRSNVISTEDTQVSGDYAEWLLLKYWNVSELPPINTKGYDLLVPQLGKVQVKSRRLKALPNKYKDCNYLAVQRLNQKEFDFLALILFESDWSIDNARLLTWAEADHLQDYYLQAKDKTRYYTRLSGKWHTAEAVLDLRAFQQND